MVLFFACVECTVGRVVLSVLGCGVRGRSGKRSVLTELSGGEVLVMNVNSVVVVEGVVVFKALG